MEKEMPEKFFENKPWWDYLGEDLTELLEESFLIFNTAKNWGKFHDYSFIVFPAAKAYEGFLKKLFLDLGFINNNDYYGKRFRIGKALNPNLETELRARESVYDKLVNFCGGKSLADSLWETWKQCRNSLFHWFPEEKTVISYDDSKDRLDMIIDSIDKAFEGCKIKNGKK